MFFFFFFFISAGRYQNKNPAQYISGGRGGNEKGRRWVSALLPVFWHIVVNTISWDMHDILRHVSSCLKKKDLGGDLQMIPFRVLFSFLFCRGTKPDILDSNICMSLSMSSYSACSQYHTCGNKKKAWSLNVLSERKLSESDILIDSNSSNHNANVRRECERTPGVSWWILTPLRFISRCTNDNVFWSQSFGWLCKQMVRFTTASRQGNCQGHFTKSIIQPPEK